MPSDKWGFLPLKRREGSLFCGEWPQPGCFRPSSFPWPEIEGGGGNNTTGAGYPMRSGVSLLSRRGGNSAKYPEKIGSFTHLTLRSKPYLTVGRLAVLCGELCERPSPPESQAGKEAGAWPEAFGTLEQWPEKNAHRATAVNRRRVDVPGFTRHPGLPPQPAGCCPALCKRCSGGLERRNDNEKSSGTFACARAGSYERSVFERPGAAGMRLRPRPQLAKPLQLAPVYVLPGASAGSGGMPGACARSASGTGMRLRAGP